MVTVVFYSVGFFTLKTKIDRIKKSREFGDDIQNARHASVTQFVYRFGVLCEQLCVHVRQRRQRIDILSR